MKSISIAIPLVFAFGLVQSAQALMINESCTDCPQNIGPDATPETNSFLDIGFGGRITDVDVAVHISGQWSTINTISISHDSTSVLLFDGWGGDLAGISEVTFDDQAAMPINTASTSGSYQPDPGVLSDFAGLDVNGAWQLQVVANGSGDSAQLLDWRLIAEVPEPPTSLLLLAALPLLGRRLFK